MRRFNRGSRYGQQYYGLDANTGAFIPPETPPNRDDVSGLPIPFGRRGIQDGLVIDTSPGASVENENRKHLGQVYVLYDPALGYQQRPAGEPLDD